MKRLWAPWRYKFFDQPKEGCFICRAVQASPDHDRENLLLIRGQRACVILNRYPYTVGALMIAPQEHRATVQQVDDKALLEMVRLSKEMMTVLDRAVKPQGYNLGINQGEAAGAGLKEHLHLHLVPRWNADVNFMTSIGEARVLAEEPEHMYDKLKQAMLSLANEHPAG